jgi:hypothetical protein
VNLVSVEEDRWLGWTGWVELREGSWKALGRLLEYSGVRRLRIESDIQCKLK